MKFSKTTFIILATTIFAIISGLLAHDPIIGSMILLCGILGAYFASVGKRSNYIFGLVSYLLMGYVAFINHLYGTGIFYLAACFPLQIHGFITWSKNLENANVKARRFTPKISAIVIVVCIISSAIVGSLLSLIPSQQLSFLDAASNCVNLCGIILMNLRYMESWWVWLVNNILDFTIWSYILATHPGSGAIMMFITAIFYLITNIYGIYNWMKTSHIEKLNPKGEPAA